jgi:hypothetical protein
MRPVTISARRSQGIALHEKALTVPADEEHVLRHRLQSELPHLGDISVARQAEGHSLDLVQSTPEVSHMSLLCLELGRVPAMAVRALDVPTGMDTVQKPHPHVCVAHDAGVFLQHVPGHGVLGVSRSYGENQCR